MSQIATLESTDGDTMKSLATAELPPPAMDRSQFSQLVRDHHGPLLAYARVLAGQPQRGWEQAQDAFVAAWQTIGRFDVTRDFGSWLRGIVRNKWREDCRKRGREIPLGDPELACLEEAVRTWSARDGEAGLLACLAECRAKLPESLSQADIAECPWTAGHQLVRVAIKGREIEKSQRPASNLVSSSTFPAP